MKKSVTMKVSGDNSFGVASTILGIFSILMAPFNGLILGVIALIFSNKQKLIAENKWSRAGKILSVIGIILSIVLIILLIVGYKTNPALFETLGSY